MNDQLRPPATPSLESVSLKPTEKGQDDAALVFFCSIMAYLIIRYNLGPPFPCLRDSFGFIIVLAPLSVVAGVIAIAPLAILYWLFIGDTRMIARLPRDTVELVSTHYWRSTRGWTMALILLVLLALTAFRFVPPPASAPGAPVYDRLLEHWWPNEDYRC